jgi:hypothetical protein
MILQTIEIRWIIPGEAPAAVKDWYERDPLCSAEKPRVDYYLKFPGDEFIGIKLRRYTGDEHNLEFKPVKKASVSLPLPSGIGGRVEEWEKWSMEGQAAQELSKLLRKQPDRWRAVRKARWLRHYTADPQIIRKIDANQKAQRSTPGCNVEFAELGLGAVDEIKENEPARGRPFWTIGLEATSGAQPADKTLEQVLRLECDQSPAELTRRLTAENSRSYPSWLTRVGA